MKSKLAAALLFFCSLAFAQEPLQVFILAKKTAIPQVGVEALSVLFEDSDAKRYELGGAIIQHDGRIYYTIVLSTLHAKDRGVIASAALRLPPGYKLLAIYHNHPCAAGYDTAYFSEIDVQTAQSLKVPSFILDVCTGDVHEFNPATDKLNGPGIDEEVVEGLFQRRTVHILFGTVVGNIGATGPVIPADDF